MVHDFLVRFKFVGLYFVKDMEEWAHQITVVAENLSDDEFDDEFESGIEGDKKGEFNKKRVYKQHTLDLFYNTIAENLPFGVIPMDSTVSGTYGQYVVTEDRLAMRREITFEPVDPLMEELFDFKVIDRDVKFLDTDPNCVIGKINTNDELVPLSPFIDLFLQSELIREAETQIFDYNSMQVYREEYAIAVPQPDAPISNMTDQHLYSVNTILGLKQMENMEKEDFAMKNAQSNINRLLMDDSLHRPTFDNLQPSIGLQRLIDNKRPQRTHFLKLISQSVQIPNLSHNAPTHNIEQMRSKYDNDVCSIMALPYVFYKPYGNHHNTSSSTSNQSHSGGGGGGGGGENNGSKLEFAQKLVDNECVEQHRLFDELFREIYMRTFSKLNVTLFDKGMKKQSNSRVGVDVGIRFDRVIVKSDDAVRNLVQYYQAGVIDGNIIRRFIYQNYGITDEDPNKEPVNNPNNNNDNNNKKKDGSEEARKPKKATKPEEGKKSENQDKAKSKQTNKKSLPKKPKKKKKDNEGDDDDDDEGED